MTVVPPPRPSAARLLFAVVWILLPVSVLSQSSLRERTFTTAGSVAESTTVDLTTAPGRILLRTGQNTNIAAGRPVTVRYASLDPARISSNPNSKTSNLTDGIVASANFFELPPGQEGTQLLIDLGAIRLVNRVEMRVNNVAARDFRVRGYSIFVGLDSLIFRRVKLVAENDTTVTDDVFNPDTARFIMIQVDRQDRLGGFSTLLSEVRVFGVGYLSGGMYTSTVRDLGRNANVGAVRWWGQFPAGTRATMRVRTGTNPVVDALWSPWSAEVEAVDGLPEVFEPRRFVQFRAIMYTDALDSPRLDSLEISYDTLLVATSASASITPRTVEILQETEISYDIVASFAGATRGIDTIAFQTRIPLVVTAATLDGNPLSYSTLTTPGRLAVAFTPAITSGTRISLRMKFTPVLLTNRVPSSLISRGASGNPQRVDVSVTGGQESWTVVSVGVPVQLISTVTADPNPFTPNGDGRNDVSFISFIITNLLEAKPLRVTVFDITGRPVRRLFDGETSARAFVEQDALVFDGRDDGGNRLPPGLYLYQVTLDQDGFAPSVVTRTITIAY